MKKTKVWDSYIRFYHWLQVFLLGGLWFTADQGEMEIHFLLAYSLLSLWLTRIAWGLVGSETAKFSRFISHPAKAISYIKHKKAGTGKPTAGHNPLGGYMVLLMLGALGFQLFSGLFASDDIMAEGPLVASASEEFVSLMTSLHRQNFDLLLVLVVCHLVAVFVHLLGKENLIKPMFTGVKLLPKEMQVKLQSGKLAWALALFLAVIIYLSWGVNVRL